MNKCRLRCRRTPRHVATFMGHCHTRYCYNTEEYGDSINGWHTMFYAATTFRRGYDIFYSSALRRQIHFIAAITSPDIVIETNTDAVIY